LHRDWYKKQTIKRYIIRSLIVIIILIFIIHILIVSIILQIPVELGIPNHVWQEKRSDQFKPEVCAGWLAYIRETYPNGLVGAAYSMGDSLLELVD
jgi:hypothetical protein